jgi:hypothetical protein
MNDNVAALVGDMGCAAIEIIPMRFLRASQEF